MTLLDVETSRVEVNELDDVVVVFGGVFILVLITIIITRAIKNRKKKLD